MIIKLTEFPSYQQFINTQPLYSGLGTNVASVAQEFTNFADIEVEENVELDLPPFSLETTPEGEVAPSFVDETPTIAQDATQDASVLPGVGPDGSVDPIDPSSGVGFGNSTGPGTMDPVDSPPPSGPGPYG